ncbi:HlyD family efflux transporter periplasmic adaptor subunit [Catalinimonas sp. 4WD22]|uniref:HlyD family secretion protein n=1 Tax=Catalinimonas locisalis TaxID=3133978 RepID=UPI0031012E96
MKIKNKKLFTSKNGDGQEDEQSSPSSGYFSAKILKPSSLPRTLAYWSYGLLGLGIITLFLPWTQNIRSYGYVTTFKPGSRPQTIHATIAGRVEEWYVNEGEMVEKGDTIVQLSEVKDEYLDPEILARLEEQLEAKTDALEATHAKADALDNRIAALKDALQLSLEKAENKVLQFEEKVEIELADYSAAETAYEVAKEQAQRYDNLYEDGLASKQERENYRLKLQQTLQKFVSAENKLSIARRDLTNARIELNSLKAEYMDKIAKAKAEVSSTLAYIADIESEIFKLRNKFASVQERKGFLNIVAPQDAHVVNAMVSGIGETVKVGEAVVSILPTNPDLAVSLFIDPIDVPLIEVGTPVRLQFEGWPAVVFSGWPDTGYGTFGGRIAVINNVANDKGKFRVLVVPESEGKEWPEQLNVRAGALGWMMLRDVPIWYEIWRNLNGFPPEYTGVLTEEETFEKELKFLKKIKPK